VIGLFNLNTTSLLLTSQMVLPKVSIIGTCADRTQRDTLNYYVEISSLSSEARYVICCHSAAPSRERLP